MESSTNTTKSDASSILEAKTPTTPSNGKSNDTDIPNSSSSHCSSSSNVCNDRSNATTNSKNASNISDTSNSGKISKAGYNNGLKKRGGHSTKQDPNKVDTSGERVIEPRQTDVLCGRGGMSNHHPGNEWYRRLIRSNRPLYRACPKHTKLLVAKAIVQAVEQQDGRFVERDIKSGFWFPVPYKRAVDKTSQGLRERERDESTPSKKPAKNNKDGQDDDDDDDEEEEEMVTVPESFSGKSKEPPNLRALAQVAIDSANRDKFAAPPRTAAAAAAVAARPAVPPSANPHCTNGIQYSTNYHPTNPLTTTWPSTYSLPLPSSLPRLSSKGQPIPNRADITNYRAKAVQHALKRPVPPTANEETSIFPSMSTRKTTFSRALPTIARQVQSNFRASSSKDFPASLAEDDVTPLPSSMQCRESSMFRMLKHTKLLPGTSSATTNGGNVFIAAPQPYPNGLIPHNGNASNYPSQLPVQKQYPQQSHFQSRPQNFFPAPQQPIVPQRTEPRDSVQFQSRGSASQQQQQQQNFFSTNQQHPGIPTHSEPHNGEQFNSQSSLSQQLHQFQIEQQFPSSQLTEQPRQQPASMNVDSAKQKSYQASRTADLHCMESALQSDSTQPQPDFPQANDNRAPALTRFTSQVSDWLNSFWPTDNNNPNAVRQASTLLLRNETLCQQSDRIDLYPKAETASVSTSSSSKKRKAQNSLPRLPYGVSDSIDLESQANVAYQMPVDAITPADLDTSVSATLLKMAGTPSKLFSGLTSFFVDRAMSEALPLRDKTTVALGNGTSVASSATNKNATAPTGLTKKSQNSLLDDYDESPMETRLRTVQYA